MTTAGMGALPPDDDSLAAAAAAAARENNRIEKVLDDALDAAAMSMLAKLLGGDGAEEAEERFGTAMWELLDRRLDDDTRITAIAMLLEPLAEQKAHELRKDFYRRLASTPEVPHPLGSREGHSV